MFEYFFYDPPITYSYILSVPELERVSVYNYINNSVTRETYVLMIIRDENSFKKKKKKKKKKKTAPLFSLH